jgi:hypothetical protein
MSPYTYLSNLYQSNQFTGHTSCRVSSVRATLTVLANSSDSRSSQGRSEVNIYARRELVYNTCLARGNLKRMLQGTLARSVYR